MKNKSKLKQHIDSFIDERLEENRSNILCNKDVRKLADKYLSLFDTIEISTNNEKLTDEYKSIELNLKRIELQEAYKLGAKDSIKILYE